MLKDILFYYTRWVLLFAALTWSYQAHMSQIQTPTPVHIVSERLDLDLTTEKVVHIEGTIDFDLLTRFDAEMEKASRLKGPIVVIINSPGGFVEAGSSILLQLLIERSQGSPLVCVVKDYAHSMAFNILSFCDLRLVENSEAQFIAHKIASYIDPAMYRQTAKLLHKVADELDEADEVWAKKNSEEMHLSREEYDRFADMDFPWRADILMSMGYIDGVLDEPASGN